MSERAGCPAKSRPDRPSWNACTVCRTQACPDRSLSSCRSTDRGEEMVLASKAVHCGIVFLLLAMEISGPHPTPITSRVGLESEVPGVSFPNDTDKMQQILQDKGHYRGKVDGVFGLRTRASIRSYQKAENLPVTGQLDRETARRLGVAPV